MLDAFLGSGTTLMAAQRVGRICYGLEIDPLYVDTAIRRWQADTGQDAIHAATGETFTVRQQRVMANLGKTISDVGREGSDDTINGLLSEGVSRVE